MQELLGDLATRANADAEFLLAARFWQARLALRDESSGSLVEIADGRIRQVAACAPDAPCDVSISAPRDEWARFLAPVPQPFYQDLWGAWTRHGFELGGDVEGMHAYYPALRRMLELLRVDA